MWLYNQCKHSCHNQQHTKKRLYRCTAVMFLMGHYCSSSWLSWWPRSATATALLLQPSLSDRLLFLYETSLVFADFYTLQAHWGEPIVWWVNLTESTDSAYRLAETGYFTYVFISMCHADGLLLPVHRVWQHGLSMEGRHSSESRLLFRPPTSHQRNRLL